MVEVAGLELAASSTRNWRATNCATPRNIHALQSIKFVRVCQGLLVDLLRILEGGGVAGWRFCGTGEEKLDKTSKKR